MSDEQQHQDSDRLHAIIRSLNGGSTSMTETAMPDETDVHYERLRAYVSNITLTSLNEIGALREECSELIRTVHERQDTLLQQIHAYSVLAKSLLESKKIMADALAGINEQFKSLPFTATLPSRPTH